MWISCYGAKGMHIRLNLVGGKAPVTLVWDDNATAGIERNNLGPVNMQLLLQTENFVK
jgi:hypothetical protein